MKIEKKEHPYKFFFLVFEAFKSVKFHFWLGTIPRNMGDYRDLGYTVCHVPDENNAL